LLKVTRHLQSADDVFWNYRNKVVCRVIGKRSSLQGAPTAHSTKNSIRKLELIQSVQSIGRVLRGKITLFTSTPPNYVASPRNSSRQI
jgi:hypothetical protein